MSSKTHKWTKTWIVDDLDPKNPLPAGVAQEGGQFRLKKNKTKKGASATYTVEFDSGNMPNAWGNCVLTAKGTRWPASNVSASSLSPSAKPVLESAARAALLAFDDTTKRLVGQITAGADLCDITMYQVPNQVAGNKDLLIIKVEDHSSGQLPDGGVYGHSI